MNKQLVQFNFSDMSEKQYDQVWDELRRVGHANPSGLLHHVAAFQGNNCLVFDVWESSEAFDKFGKILMPILNKLGIKEAKPMMTPVLKEMSFAESTIHH